MKLRASTLVLLPLLIVPGAAADEPDIEGGKGSFDAYAERSRSTTGNQIDASSISSGEADAVEVENPIVEVNYRLACGDSDENLRVDSLCDTSLFRCGEDDGGLTYFITAIREDGARVRDTDCYDPQFVEAQQGITDPRVTPALVLRAFERIPLPESEVVIQPPGGQTLVGLDTIFSTEANRFTESVTLLGRSVELDITPTSYRWSHGDSTTQTTDWPGRSWSRGASSYITHVYDDRMRVSTSVDTTWSARFRVDGGPWQEVPGTVTVEGDPAPLRVRSASPHLVGVSDR